LAQQTLSYYVKQTDNTPERVIPLENGIALPCEASAHTPFSFKICRPKQKPVYFRAKSKREQESWLKALTAEIEGTDINDVDLISEPHAKTITLEKDLGDLADWTDLGILSENKQADKSNQSDSDSDDAEEEKPVIEKQEEDKKEQQLLQRLSKIPESQFSMERLQYLYHKYRPIRRMYRTGWH